MQKALALEGGFHPGVLFIIVKRKLGVKRFSGGKEVWIKYTRARPGWATPESLTKFWKESKRMTALTGIQHSVDHIVPLVNHLVCGLHCEDNLIVRPLSENVRKSNLWWPDMPYEQPELF